jgi:8-oxo-dGTP diphosphatase
LSIDAALGRPAMSPWTAEFLAMADERRAALGW